MENKSNIQKRKPQATRRDFLGLASLGAIFLSSITALGGILRMIKPTVKFEEPTRFKIGTLDTFPVGTVKKLDDKGVFVFSTDQGLHAISSICTYLGCIVAVSETGFQCPCHGSKYNESGKVVGGPAPRNLAWLEISKSVDGSLEIDISKEVPPGTRFMFSA